MLSSLYFHYRFSLFSLIIIGGLVFSPKNQGHAQSEPQDTRPLFRICTGHAQNHYYHVGKMIAKSVVNELNVQLIETRGSLENLYNIHLNPPKCDAIIAQDDAYALFLFDNPQHNGRITRLAQLYPEYIHLVCNRQAVRGNDLDELKSKDLKILVGSEGSGTYITWNLMKRLNQNYGLFGERTLSGIDALIQVSKGIQAQCMLSVTALAQGFVARGNDDFGDRLKLVSISNTILQTPINQGKQSRRLYHPIDVHKNVYPRLLNQHLKTQTVDAVLFVHARWLSAYPKYHQLLSSTLNQLKEAILSSIH